MYLENIKWKSSKGTALYVMNGNVSFSSTHLADPLGEGITKEVCKKEIEELMRRVSRDLTGSCGSPRNPVLDYWFEVHEANDGANWSVKFDAFCPPDVTPFRFVNAFENQLQPSDWFTGPLLVDFRQNDSWLWEFILEEKY